MFNAFRNIFVKGYRNHSEAVVISCFYNPQKNEYRQKAFDVFYQSIAHLNYRILECVIGDDAPQLSHYKDKNINLVRAEELLWHKETLLNKIIAELPPNYKYVFWLDADIVFDNDEWLIDGVAALQNCNIIQPFEYAVHLNQNEKKPSFDYKMMQKKPLPEMLAYKMWRSFCSNANTPRFHSENYNEHGHVGFAWAARREILEKLPLYEKALIGGADHIMAHGAANQPFHACIAKTFTDDLETVQQYMKYLGKLVNGQIGFCKGTLFHIWHGDIEKRQYFQRVKDFTPMAKNINIRDKNGFFTSQSNFHTTNYIRQYFDIRENTHQNHRNNHRNNHHNNQQHQQNNDENDANYDTENTSLVTSNFNTNFTDNNNNDADYATLIGAVLGEQFIENNNENSENIFENNTENRFENDTDFSNSSTDFIGIDTTNNTNIEPFSNEVNNVINASRDSWNDNPFS